MAENLNLTLESREVFRALNAMMPGLPKNLTRLDLHWKHAQITTVECEFYPSVDRDAYGPDGCLKTAVASFELRVKPEGSNGR
jgi:hypothetical protein